MKNTNYKSEMASAHKWILEHNNDLELQLFLNQLREAVNNPTFSHSDRWSITYDWMQEHYPEVTGSIVTGLAYWCED